MTWDTCSHPGHGHHPPHLTTTGPSDDGLKTVLIDYGGVPGSRSTDVPMKMFEPRQTEMTGRGGGGRPDMIRAHSHGKILETHFDDPPYHTRSSSYSVSHSGKDTLENLNNSFPGADTNLPYISASVTLPAGPGDQAGFYHNVSGRIRQPSLRHKEDVRNSFSRQADLHKSPRTQELEEFAAKFEGYQKQRTRRLAAQPTPLLDQLARETNTQFWLQTNPDQLSTLESSLLRLVQRNDSITTRAAARGILSDDNSSGRESVTTVISNSSSETIKFNERHSSCETLTSARFGDNDTEADVRHDRERAHSICDEIYLGQGHTTQHDDNYNTWRVKQRPETENNNNGAVTSHWDNGHAANIGDTSLYNKRSLYRSHSEAGTGWIDPDQVSGLVRGGRDGGHNGVAGHLARDDVTRPWPAAHTTSHSRHSFDELQSQQINNWQNSNQVQVVRGSWCSYCGARHPDHHDTCPSHVTRVGQDVRLRATQEPLPDNAVVEKNTFPRRATRNRKPKLPTPPCSPLTGTKSARGRSCTPSPPPPPLPDQDQLISLNEPLPPPPVETLTDNKSQGLKTNVYHSSGQTKSEAKTLEPSQLGSKTPAATPKRESPATIAAKEAPGWEKFLGVKSQTVSFTSEEATKFRAARDESRSRNGGTRKDDTRTRGADDRRGRQGTRASLTGQDHVKTRNQQNIQRRDVLNNFFHKMEENSKDDAKEKQQQQPHYYSENTPKTRREEVRNKKYSRSGNDENHNIQNSLQLSPDDKQHSLHLSRERSLKSISNWWKNSLEGGPTPPPQTWSDGDSPNSHRHNHSHSDSGISSMSGSGRSSCMSPMSELSSSSGSSRTSLRSSSIVSASNILLEEEGESEMEYTDLCRELIMFAPSDSRIVGLLKASLSPSLQVYFPEGTLEFEIISSKDCYDLEPSKRSRSTNFEESRKNLLKHACLRIDTQRKHQKLLKESTRNNEEIGKEVLSELKQVCQQQEIDKVKLFTEEVDKITSLIIGLSSRLAKVNASSAKNTHPDEKLQRLETERKEKLEEQLDEARKLRQSIFRRGDLVFNILQKYLDPQCVDSFGGFIKEKIRLILENRQHSEVLKNEEEILKSLKEYNAETGVMII